VKGINAGTGGTVETYILNVHAKILSPHEFCLWMTLLTRALRFTINGYLRRLTVVSSSSLQ